MDRIVRVDVGGEQGPVAIFEPIGKYTGFGGRAMTSAIICGEVPPDCHPLGPENKLVIAPGLMSGSAATTSSRLSVGCKSPLTGTIATASTSGQAAGFLGRLDIAAIVLEGEPKDDKLRVVYIDKDGVSIKEADNLHSLPNYAACDSLRHEYGDNVAILSIGTAGEMGLANSTIAVSDSLGQPTRHASHGGVGAVMGSKGIKAIVLNAEATDTRMPLASEVFTEAHKKLANDLKLHIATRHDALSDRASLLSENAIQALLEGECGLMNLSTRGCQSGCVIKCSGFLSGNGCNCEYLVTAWALCGITDMSSASKLDYLSDDYGFDSIEMGLAIGLAMEVGVIPYGDVEGAVKLITMAGKGKPLGRIVGSGVEIVAKCYGIESSAMIKSQAIRAYGLHTRAKLNVKQDLVSRAVDHTTGYATALKVLTADCPYPSLDPELLKDLPGNLDTVLAAMDATGFCLFVAFALFDHPETFEAMIGTINGLYDLNLDIDDMIKLGQRTLSLENDFDKKTIMGNQKHSFWRF